MVYLIGNKIKISTKGFWNEGVAYQKNVIYQKSNNSMPPVNYDEHILKPHSLTHVESGKHTQNDGSTLDILIENNPEYFVGECLVLKFEPDYKNLSDNLFIQKIKLNDLKSKLMNYYDEESQLKKLIISTENYPIDPNDYHQENHILILELETAEYLISLPNFNLYGTTWKSTDYQPNKIERPVHDTLFQKAVIFELLNINHVPEGIYQFYGMPLYLEGASESPVTPILIS